MLARSLAALALALAAAAAPIEPITVSELPGGLFDPPSPTVHMSWDEFQDALKKNN